MRSKLIIGWREWAGLPDFGISQIKAKIDTGAKTSAIHAYHVKKIIKDNREYAEFRLHPVQNRKRPEISCCAPILDERIIRSSNGQTESRYVVETILCLGPFSKKIELTLTNRDELGFRMLIGRQALSGHYVVDSHLSYGLGEPEKTKQKGT